MSNKDLEARFVALKQQAKDMGAELGISLVIGGVDVSKLYRIHRLDDKDETLAESLDTQERNLADDRTKALAAADRRLTDAEATQELVDTLVRVRTDEFVVARDAWRQSSDQDPAKTDTMQEVIAGLVAFEQHAHEPKPPADQS